MRKSLLVLTSFAILMGGCSNESKSENKGATKIESKQEQVKEIFKVSKKDGKPTLELMIDPRDEIFSKYLLNGQLNLNGIKIGADEGEIEKKLGKAEKVITESLSDKLKDAVSKADAKNLLDKYKDIKETKEYYYNDFLIGVKDGKVAGINIFSYTPTKEVEEKVKKEFKGKEIDGMKIDEDASENMYKILSKKITKEGLGEDKLSVIELKDGNFLSANIKDKKMGGVLRIANKSMTDLMYDVNILTSKSEDGDEKNAAQKEEESSDTEGTVSVVNGISHYNIPDILSEEFAKSIKQNTFEIDGFGLLKPSDKDPYTSLKPDPSQSADGTAVYDNFQFGLKNGTGGNASSINNSTPIASITLDVAEQSVLVDDLIEKWNLEKLAFDGGNFKIFNLDSGIHVTLNYDSDSKIINDIVLTEGEFNELSGLEGLRENESNDVSFTKDEVLTYEFGQKVLSNQLNLGGDINVTSMPVNDEVVNEKFGKPDSQNGGDYSFSTFNLSTRFQEVIEISLNVSDKDISLDDLKNTWNKDIETEKESDGALHTIYDATKDNGYFVDVVSESGTVTNINIVTDAHGY